MYMSGVIGGGKLNSDSSKTKDSYLKLKQRLQRTDPIH